MLIFRFLIVLAAGLTFSLSSATAQQTTKIRFTLDWKLQGIHSWYYWAQDKGYFAAEKLDVTIDQGEGSAATISRIMTGAYDAGFGDVNAIIQTAAQRPGEAPVMVFMLYSKAPFALLTKASSPVKTVKDMSGRKLGAPAGATALKLFTPLAKKAGIDPSSVDVVNMSPNLQEQMLLQGQVDASAVFTATSYMNLVAQRLDPDKDFRWIYYDEAGLDLYSNGVMVSAKLAKENPEAVRGLVRAITKAIRDVLANPAAAIDLLASKEPLINKDIERRRLVYVVNTLMATPEAAEIGLGDIKDARMNDAIKTIVSSYELKNTPALGDIFNRSFLPAKADRMMPPIAN